jgi:hypothetical protein
VLGAGAEVEFECIVETASCQPALSLSHVQHGGTDLPTFAWGDHHPNSRERGIADISHPHRRRSSTAWYVGSPHLGGHPLGVSGRLPHSQVTLLWTRALWTGRMVLLRSIARASKPRLSWRSSGVFRSLTIKGQAPCPMPLPSHVANRPDVLILSTPHGIEASKELAWYLNTKAEGYAEIGERGHGTAAALSIESTVGLIWTLTWQARTFMTRTSSHVRPGLTQPLHFHPHTSSASSRLFTHAPFFPPQHRPLARIRQPGPGDLQAPRGVAGA